MRGIQSQEVSVCLHKPSDPVVRRIIQVWVEERPELFDAYQSTHGALPEATVKSRRFFASFVATTENEFVFTGLFEREVGPVLKVADWLENGQRLEMLQLVEGHRRELPQVAEELANRTLFHLHRNDQFTDLERRLTCRDPGGRAYMRRAETTPLEILELSRVGRISPLMPDWRELQLSSAEVRQLPRDWAVTLRNWRGVYLLIDDTDGQRYVGSAYGNENLLGRWQQHVAGEHGITRELGQRNPVNFRFSILELLAPTAVVEDVIALENTWKLRIDTRRHGLNGN